MDDNQIAILEPVQTTTLGGPSAEEFDLSLVEAAAKAKSLKAVISENAWSVRIGKSEHIRVEAWITLASGYGCTAKVVEGSVKRLDGYPIAYEARAEVLRHTPNGPIVIGAAEAECGTEGDANWDHGKPAYAVRSMAQTRAISKAISSVFRWVVVLAGYSGTPFEDMPQTPGAPMGEQPAGGPSEKQVKYLRSLGYTGDPSALSRTEVSRIIDDLKASSSNKALDGFLTACADRGWSAAQVKTWLGDRSPEDWVETTGNSLRAAYKVCETKSEEDTD